MWLLALSVKQLIEQAYAAGTLPTVEQQASYEARYGFSDGDGSRILTTAGDVADINVSGVMTKSPSLMAMLFGGGNVTYPEIISALAEADSNPDVKRAEMRIDSPGGHVDGLFAAMEAVKDFSKPIKVVVQNLAASAAYFLASPADEIVAANKAARIGSVGTVASFAVEDDIVEITNTESPRKRPDVTTEAGKAMVREELDAIHELFAGALAEGRSTTVEKVNAEFGRGATLLAEEALKRGMIDSIAGAAPALRVVKTTKTQSTASGGNKPETGPMDLSTLKASHPDVYAAAVQEGVTKERDRVSAHLEMGEAAESLDIAVKAIKDGDEYTAKHMASYNAAALRKRDQANRQDDDAAAAAAADSAQQERTGDDAADQVLALVENSLGIAAGE